MIVGRVIKPHSRNVLQRLSWKKQFVTVELASSNRNEAEGDIDLLAVETD